MRDAALGHQEDAGKFGAELFLGIFDVAKSVAIIECFAVEALFCASPVSCLMERRSVIASCGVEGSPRREMNGVGKAIVECAIGLVMKDPGAAVLKNCFRALDHLPFLAHPRRI